MSFFAGFVQGVFEGKDWREARDDRARKRKMEDERFGWEREDREWTGEARSRQRSEWGRTDYERSRADAEHYRQEDFDRRNRESLAAAFESSRDGSAGASDQGISVLDAVPQDAPADARTAQPTRPTQRGALSAMPELGVLGAGVDDRSMGEVVPQGRQGASSVPLQMGERVPQQSAGAATRAAPVQTTEAAPDPALVAEGAQIAGVQPYVPGQERGAPAQPQAPAQGGFSLNNLIASPAAASTMPEGGPQRPAGQATQDAVQGRGQGYSDYTEATRGFRSDAPRRGTLDQMVSTERSRQAQPAAAPQSQGRVPMLSEQDAARSQRAISLFPQGQDFDTPEEAAARQQGRIDMDTRRQQREDARNARIESANAQSAAAAGVDIGPVSPPPTQPAPATAPTQPESARTPEQRAEQRAAAEGSYTVNLGGAELNISGARRVLSGGVAETAKQIAGAFGADAGSLDAAGDAISKQPSMGVADAFDEKKKPTRQEVLAVSRRAGQMFSRDAIRERERFLMREGKFEEAKAWREFAQGENTIAAVEKLTESMFYWDMGDETRALQAIVEVYNMNGYYDDGLSIVKEGTEFQRDASGQIIGLTATFKDNATGNLFQRSIRGPEDKIMAVVIGSLTPEATFEAALEAVGGIAGATARPQTGPTISYADARKMALTELEKLGGSNNLSGMTREQINEAVHNLALQIQQGSSAGNPAQQSESEDKSQTPLMQ